LKQSAFLDETFDKRQETEKTRFAISVFIVISAISGKVYTLQEVD